MISDTAHEVRSFLHVTVTLAELLPKVYFRLMGHVLEVNDLHDEIDLG